MTGSASAACEVAVRLWTCPDGPGRGPPRARVLPLRFRLGAPGPRPQLCRRIHDHHARTVAGHGRVVTQPGAGEQVPVVPRRTLRRSWRAGQATPPVPKRGRSRAGHALVAVRASPVVDIDHDTMNRPGLLGTRATIVGVSMVSAEREVQLPPLPLPGAMPREVRGRCGPSTGTSSTSTIRRRSPRRAARWTSPGCMTRWSTGGCARGLPGTSRNTAGSCGGLSRYRAAHW